MPTEGALAKSKELNWERIREIFANASPLALDVIAKDIQWLIEQPNKFPKFGLRKMSVEDWLTEVGQRGCKYHRDQFERSIAAKQREANELNATEELNAYSKVVANTPGAASSLEKLIELAKPFKSVTIQAVCEFHALAKQASQK